MTKSFWKEIAMGLFDKMFGRGATAAQSDANAQQRFNQLKGKYQSVLNLVEQQQIQLQNLHVQDNKLFADINVDASRAVGAAAGGGQGQGGQTYEVKSGDNLSKISKQFYGDPNEYMRIYYADRKSTRLNS